MAVRIKTTPRRGKAKVKVTASGKKVSYGQAGKAKGGGARVKPGTSKGDSYCARSLGIKKRLSKKKQNDPNTPNNLSRKRWKCAGAKSKRKKWLKQKVVGKYAKKERHGPKEPLIHTPAHMQIWPHLNIVKTQTMLKDLKRK